jgi:hypothetical protein
MAHNNHQREDVYTSKKTAEDKKKIRDILSRVDSDKIDDLRRRNQELIR